MLDTNLKNQLKAYFEKIDKPVALVASLDESEKSSEMLALLQEVAEQSNKITLSTDGQATNRYFTEFVGRQSAGGDALQGRLPGRAARLRGEACLLAWRDEAAALPGPAPGRHAAEPGLLQQLAVGHAVR